MKKTLSVILAAALTACILPLNTSALTVNYTPSDSYKNSSYYTALTDVTLTGNYHTDLVNVAASQLGYMESNSSYRLSGDSSGSLNYTEYGRRFNNNGAAWCAYFVSYCAETAGIPTSVIKHTGWATADDFGVTWHERDDYTPVPGDLIIFDYSPYNTAQPRSSHGDHVGIVEYIEYSGGYTYIHTIEGNCNNRVQRCCYLKSNSSIKGYGSYQDAAAEKEPENAVVDILRANIGFKASVAANQKVNAYDENGGYAGRVYENDIFTVNEILFVNGEWRARLCCPWSENGRSFNKTVYIPLNAIVPDTSYTPWIGRATCKITTYRHTDRRTTTGYIAKDDLVYILCESGGSTLALYPLASGFKLGWF